MVPSQLRGFKDRAAFDTSERLRPSHQLSGLGRDEEHALLVLVPHVRVAERLRNLGIQHDQEHLKAIERILPDIYERLEDPAAPSSHVRNALKDANSALKRVTENKMEHHPPFFFGSQLPIGSGQPKSFIAYVLSKARVLAAKVFIDDEEAFDREVGVRRNIDNHRNLAPFIDHFVVQDLAQPTRISSHSAGTSSSLPVSFRNIRRHAIVMPLYASSVSYWHSKLGRLSFETIQVIGRDCFSALSHIHAHHMSYADLKPCNIMLDSSEEEKAILVDFGAVVPLGNPITEVSSPYFLDLATLDDGEVHLDTLKGSQVLDWTCLGSTLAQLSGIHIFKDMKRRELYDAVGSSSSINPALKDVIQACLLDPTEISIGNAIQKLNGVLGSGH
jgi:serine/threonine protein kinase